MIYEVIKVIDHNEGLSCCFRQWRAKSHCKHLHGYSLRFEICVQGDTLDEANWLFDFGRFKNFKDKLHDWFDHVLIVAEDDPALEYFVKLHDNDIAYLRIVKNVGCEAFAEQVFNLAKDYLPSHLTVKYVKVSEHAGNSAVFNG